MGDDVWEGSIWLDGHQVANLSYAPGVEEAHRYRGVSVLLLQRNITTGHCDVISYRIFDTYDAQVEAEDLKNHLVWFGFVLFNDTWSQ